ncbi:unnamed protein product [Spirodela intermedia]|uniref:Uncharacterized protein n=1 Tax=Spirodela intermedia TaxID=51605 RepID=A0A7I8JFG5_SPIIN|nr:unnamed protein product [Spirodela intermedia]CAA6668900.1 unnamed protein product [Spirodela intermedia]
MGPLADAVSWKPSLRAFAASATQTALAAFPPHGPRGVRPTAPTMATAIAAAAEGGAPEGHVPQLHAVALRSAALISSPFVGTALVGGFAKARNLPRHARRSTKCSSRMPSLGRRSSSVPAWTAIVDGHMKDGEPGEARQCFDGMPLRNVVSWMAFIKGYVRSGMFAQAFDRFVEMARTPGAAQNEFTFSAALGACAGSSLLRSGEFLHADLIKCGGPPDAILVSSLVGMYAKCCDASVAAHAFGSLGRTSHVCWNAIIGCYARHGLRARALAEFQRMTAAGVAPDHVSFVSVLAAARARAGGVRLEATVEHYLRGGPAGPGGGAAGGLRVVDEMPVAPDLVVLGPLAAASGMHGGLELLGLAAERIGEDHPAVFTMLGKAYGETGAWGRVAEVLRRMASAALCLQRATSRIS